ncbi:hypothetical protein DSO57_1036622 [Entomophthora muscae]|uniref:Uncharacterized protein n=1 Tax=Entomophthora muscae TaxID=34485 RepID=A0ACC2SNC6_9FUNG|nr:hypothetical protein DSO57_1036622 [Entomophthora muscae]
MGNHNVSNQKQCNNAGKTQKRLYHRRFPRGSFFCVKKDFSNPYYPFWNHPRIIFFLFHRTGIPEDVTPTQAVPGFVPGHTLVTPQEQERHSIKTSGSAPSKVLHKRPYTV